MIWRGQLQQAARTQYLSRTVSPLLVCIVLCYLTSVVARKVWGAEVLRRLRGACCLPSKDSLGLPDLQVPSAVQTRPRPKLSVQRRW